MRILIATALLAFAPACRSAGEDASTFAPPQTTSTVNAAASPGRPLRTPDEVPVTAPESNGDAHAEIGAPAPDFELSDLEGHRQKLSRFRGKMVVLEWFNPTCADVLYAYGEGGLREMQARLATSGIVWLAINSAGPGDEGSDLALNQQFAAERHLPHPILLDPTGVVGRAYGARTAPHMFIINERGVLVYSGGLDNAPGGKVESRASKTNYIETAIADLRSGHAVIQSSTRPYGCEIKYARP